MLTLIFIGDSLTQWFDWEGRFPGNRVMNLGISGETVEGLLARRERIHAAVESPDFIFLMTGINNIANGQHDILVPYREFVRNLTTWYKKSKIVTQSILPVDLTWVDNNFIKDINLRLREIAREYDAAYLDVYRLFVDAKGNPKSGYLSDDGVHLAGNGYKAWANEVERFLRGQE
jgi:lysophospholipase L1-like esterase